MAQATINIDSPHDGDILVAGFPGVPIQLKGTASIDAGKITKIDLDLGGTSQTLSVSFPYGSVHQWSFSSTTPVGGDLTITATATGMAPGPHGTSDEVVSPPATITLKADVTPPVLAVTAPNEGQIFTGDNQGHLVQAKGTASDSPTGVKSVKWSLDNGPFTSANSVNNWADWNVEIQVPPGVHTLTFTCEDKVGNTSKQTKTIKVALPAEVFSVSRLSYLRALLQFALQAAISGSSRISVSGQNLTLQDLNNHLHQPFVALQLDENLKKSDEPVIQVRLCIEVLREYLKTISVHPHANAALLAAQREYLRRAYTLVLTQIGTSYDEIRLARTASPDERKNIADRLGIDLGASRPDQVDALFVDLSASSSQPAILSEPLLEEIFGLLDTSRDPFVDGIKVADPKNEITAWKLDSVEWGWNTDPEGIIYVRLNQIANTYSVGLYSDSSRLIATGEANTPVANIKLSPFGRGVSGEISINFQGGFSGVPGTEIKLILFPRLLSWRLQHVRTSWKEEDYPQDAPDFAPPIIDPDLLVQGDFKHQIGQDPPFSPVSIKDPAFSIYLDRQKTVQNWFDSLNQQRQGATTPQMGLDAILNQVLNKTSADLLSYDQDRRGGQDISGKLETLGLTFDAFTYLVRICSAVKNNLSLLDSEWTDVYSILVQVQKRLAFKNWRTVEQSANVALSPDYFTLPPRVPVVSATGVDSSGSILSDGSVDPHWTITAHPISSAPIPAYVTQNKWPVGTAWMPNSSVSRWVSPQADESVGDLVGSYTYQTSIDLSGFDPSSVRLLAKVAVDNELTDVKVNGQSLGLKASGFQEFAKLPISNGFVSGVNTLELVVNNAGTSSNPSGLRVELSLGNIPGRMPLPAWRASEQARTIWQQKLKGRIQQHQSLIGSINAGVEATEQATLPFLRDALVGASGQDVDELAERLLIDTAATSYVKTTRMAQAIESLQSLFFALRNEQLKLQPDFAAWTLTEGTDDFDQEWSWIGSYSNWRAAMLVFLYPENLLLPSWREKSEQTQEFQNLWDDTFNYRPFTPKAAHEVVQKYLTALQSNNNVPSDIKSLSSVEISNAGLPGRATLIEDLWKNKYPPDTKPQEHKYVEDAFYNIPIHLALQLQEAGYFEAALDWYKTVYSYESPKGQRKIYYGLTKEESIATQFEQTPQWLKDSLNPHDIAQTRANAYTRFVLISIVKCLLDFAHSEFAADTLESIPRARELYFTALELLDSPDMQPPAETRVIPNQLPGALRLHAELNLFKLRTSRNIAGLQRQIEVSASVDGIGTDVTSGLRLAPKTPALHPTAYRYTALIERAKQLVALAQQVEGSYLAALEKTDAEAYNMLKARQDLDLQQANVTLQEFRVKEALDSITLANDQVDKAQFQTDHYRTLLNDDINGEERASLVLQETEFGLQTVAALSTAFDPRVSAAQIFEAAAGASRTMASILSTIASYERRKQQWEFERDLAQKDVNIGLQQVQIATDHHTVVTQEQSIAHSQAAHAQATVDFLANKFTNKHLYEWMSRVLQGVYSYFLQQATGVARLAQAQLAFERQEREPSLIQGDYWQAPSEGGPPSGSDSSPDRRGLTGSARLLQDIYRLDQYAFETNKRKLQLTKTISLAQLAPIEFQRFRETGVLRFNTAMSLFDQDFPGHYLRLIKRMRTSVIAFIPPSQGIRATLSSTGVSRVIISGPVFQEAVVRRDPESVALTSPINATGVFELDTQPELLFPLEGLGVDTSLEFQMPRAANPFIEYDSIADLLISIDYTALSDFDYRQQVIQQMDTSFSAEHAFSFRQQFADQWYDLNNPNQLSTPFTVVFKTQRQDFPPNLDNLAISQVVLYFAPGDGGAVEVELEHLNLTQVDANGTKKTVGGGAKSIDSVVSTRRGNAASWTGMIGKTPIGEWELSLKDTVDTRNLFKDEKIQDILLVLTYNGQTPAWPV